jgi:hypothetical protein
VFSGISLAQLSNKPRAIKNGLLVVLVVWLKGSAVNLNLRRLDGAHRIGFVFAPKKEKKKKRNTTTSTTKKVLLTKN